MKYKASLEVPYAFFSGWLLMLALGAASSWHPGYFPSVLLALTVRALVTQKPIEIEWSRSR